MFLPHLIDAFQYFTVHAMQTKIRKKVVVRLKNRDDIMPTDQVPASGQLATQTHDDAFIFCDILSKVIHSKCYIISGKRRTFMCVGCGSQIQDQYILRVAPDLEWHATCLRCADCNQYLDESCTCFVRDGKTYCKDDYVRLVDLELQPSNRYCELS